MFKSYFKNAERQACLGENEMKTRPKALKRHKQYLWFNHWSCSLSHNINAISIFYPSYSDKK